MAATRQLDQQTLDSGTHAGECRRRGVCELVSSASEENAACFKGIEVVADIHGATVVITSRKQDACVETAADIQLARNLAIEWGKHNVRVHCIAPGLIRTDFARTLWENLQTSKTVTARTPLGRIGETDEIVGAVVYLASKAGSFMTGQTIVIDGGATIAG